MEVDNGYTCICEAGYDGLLCDNSELYYFPSSELYYFPSGELYYYLQIYIASVILLYHCYIVDDVFRHNMSYFISSCIIAFCVGKLKKSQSH